MTSFEEKNDEANAFLDEKNDGAETFLSEFTFTVFLLMLSCLRARCRTCHMLRYCPVYTCSSLCIVIIPFLYDLKGAIDSIQIKGQRLLFDRKNDFRLVEILRGKDFSRGEKIPSAQHMFP